MRVNLLTAGWIVLWAAAGRAQTPGWYAFGATGDPAPGEIGLQAWIERPAGKHGRIARQGARLVYNGKPIKLWGINLCFSACAPKKELADKRAAFYPKYGINSVRLHKFADGHGWAGIQSADSVAAFDPDALDRMPIQVARLKAAGIFTKLSAHFGTMKMGPADKRDVPYLAEFGRFDGRKNRVSAPHSALFYSPALQALHIRQIVTLLKHRNPYTKLTYAEDPAICVIEIVNEQSILFYTSMGPLQKSPTLRAEVGRRFCEWLKAKYGRHEGLVKAWGAKALDSFGREFPGAAREHLDKGTVLPLGNPWFWDPAQLAGTQAFRRRRLLDTMEFLYGLQCEAYDRYVKAVGEAGYKGEILGSNWQAGRALSHYYNLHSDWRVGMIDRHNYFGGRRRGGKAGAFNNASMLAVPGSGMLSAGMQQVADRPFMLSEWIHVQPNEWGVEGPAIIGAYGMGLQGWDVSYLFQNRDGGTFSPRLGASPWDVTAVARHVLRDDIREVEATAARFVHMPSLREGRLGSDEKVSQQHDVKTFDGDKVSSRALAVARTVVVFTDVYRETPAFDLAPHRKDAALVSTTGELRWRPGGAKLDGYFTIDTPATKAVVGFAAGRACRLGEVTIEPACRFAALYVTAQEADKTIASSKNLLIVALARARNTGQKVSESEDRLLARGQAPVLMEPVKATITLRKPGAAKVILLDHDGRATEKSLPLRDGRFTLDGARDRTPYYLVRY